jgi:transcriptional regulator with XRE-family HTH domain
MVRPIKVEMKTEGLKVDIEKEKFALALKTWRLRQNLTQAEVGARWGCSRYTIMKAESGKNITWEMAYKMFAKLSDELRKEGLNEQS